MAPRNPPRGGSPCRPGSLLNTPEAIPVVTTVLRYEPNANLPEIEAVLRRGPRLTGCMARRARFTAFGVIARLTARPGWAARRTLRGMKSRDSKPMEEE